LIEVRRIAGGCWIAMVPGVLPGHLPLTARADAIAKIASRRRSIA
jgi:hypothetical protein